jgi:hypothetical protein
MPVMLARPIGDIGIYDIAGYATSDDHGRPPGIGRYLAERSVLMGNKHYRLVQQLRLVNVSVSPWIMRDTSSLAGHI